MSPIARVNGLSITTTAGRTVLADVSVDIGSAEVVGIVGESGAGKSTLARTFLGAISPGLRVVEGTVTVTGTDPFTRAGRRAVRGRLAGYVPQDPTSALDPRRRIRSQLRAAACIADGRCDRDQRILDACNAARFAHELLTRRPGEISGGQARRALLAWVLITRPRLIILDEPTSGLDPATAREVLGEFRNLSWNPAIVLITHDHDLASSADRTLEMTAGRLHPFTPQSHESFEPTVGVSGGRPPGTRGFSVSGLTIHHGATPVVSDVGLDVGPGEIAALRGRSGSGKTSIAKALCGLAPPTSGRIDFDGVALDWNAARRVESGGAMVAYVGQDALSALNPDETVGRTLARAFDAARRRDRRGGWPIDQLLERLALSADIVERLPRQLSGGQRQRVALARAIAADPDMLVCDESTASLDPATSGQVLDAIRQLAGSRGTSVLLITHDDHVARRADRVLDLDRHLLR